MLLSTELRLLRMQISKLRLFFQGYAELTDIDMV